MVSYRVAHVGGGTFFPATLHAAPHLTDLDITSTTVPVFNITPGEHKKKQHLKQREPLGGVGGEVHRFYLVPDAF